MIVQRMMCAKNENPTRVGPLFCAANATATTFIIDAFCAVTGLNTKANSRLDALCAFSQRRKKNFGIGGFPLGVQRRNREGGVDAALRVSDFHRGIHHARHGFIRGGRKTLAGGSGDGFFQGHARRALHSLELRRRLQCGQPRLCGQSGQEHASGNSVNGAEASTPMPTLRCPIRIDGEIYKSAKGAPSIGQHTANLTAEFQLL